MKRPAAHKADTGLEPGQRDERQHLEDGLWVAQSAAGQGAHSAGSGQKRLLYKASKNLTVSARRLDKTSLGFLVIDIAWRLSGSLGHHVSSS